MLSSIKPRKIFILSHHHRFYFRLIHSVSVYSLCHSKLVIITDNALLDEQAFGASHPFHSRNSFTSSKFSSTLVHDGSGGNQRRAIWLQRSWGVLYYQLRGSISCLTRSKRYRRGSSFGNMVWIQNPIDSKSGRYSLTFGFFGQSIGPQTIPPVNFGIFLTSETTPSPLPIMVQASCSQRPQVSHFDCCPCFPLDVMQFQYQRSLYWYHLLSLKHVGRLPIIPTWPAKLMSSGMFVNVPSNQNDLN